MQQDYNVVPLFETVVELPPNIDTTVEGNVLALNQAFDQSTVYITSIIEGNWDQVLSVNGQTGDVWVNPSINDYTPKAFYQKNDMISVDGRLYRAKEKITSAPDPFDPSQWEEVDVVDNILSDFKPNYEYEKGELVAVNGRLYRAKTNFTSGATFNEADWEWVAGVVAKPFEPNQYYYKNTFIRVGQSIFAADKDFQAGEEYDPNDWTIIATAIAKEELYDNTTSRLEATNVQDAIDEVHKDLKDFESVIGEDLRKKVDSLGDQIESLGKRIDEVESDKVSKEEGKSLSTNDFTDELKAKLESIESDAEVNVQADWAESDSTSDSFIKNKPAPYVLPQATETTLGGVKAAKRTNEARKVVINESTGELYTDEDASNGIAKMEVKDGHLLVTLGDGRVLDSGSLPAGYIKRQTVTEMDGTGQVFVISPAVTPIEVTYITINGVDYNEEFYTINEAGNQITTHFPEDMVPTGKLELILTAIGHGGDGGSGEIPRFSNSLAGLFVGSNKDGEIESTGRGDGSGRVVGWENKQNKIPDGSEGDYYRGDHTWAKLDKNAVGLDNVENKSVNTIRTELTGNVTPGDENFITGNDVYEQVNTPEVKNVNPNWTESDPTSYAYIRNKPTIVNLTLSTTDIEEGSALPPNTLYGVYNG